MLTILDIETAGDPRILEKGPPEAALTVGIRDNFKPETVEEYRRKNAERWRELAATDWRSGQIIAAGLFHLQGGGSRQVCVAQAYPFSYPDRSLEEGPRPPETEIGSVVGEASLLLWLWEHVRRTDRFAGFGIRAFDLPFLYGRSLIRRVKPSLHLNLAKYRMDEVLDWQEILGNWNPETGWDLATYAELLELHHRPWGSGADVSKWHAGGDWHSIVRHLLADLDTTAELHNGCSQVYLRPPDTGGL